MRVFAAILSAMRAGQFYLALGAWLLVVVVCFGWLAIESNMAGSQHAPVRLGDVQLPVEVDQHKFTLVMIVHPKCPCSRASVSELERILAQFQDNVDCLVLVYRPAGVDQGWAETGTVGTLRSMPHTTVIVDEDARLARELGMATSGGVILYSPAGEPEYWGGITIARAHCGDNAGSDAIAAILSGSPPRGVLNRRSAARFTTTQTLCVTKFLGAD